MGARRSFRKSIRCFAAKRRLVTRPLVSATMPLSAHTLVTNLAIGAPLALVIVPRSGVTAAPPTSASVWALAVWWSSAASGHAR